MINKQALLQMVKEHNTSADLLKYHEELITYIDERIRSAVAKHYTGVNMELQSRHAPKYHTINEGSIRDVLKQYKAHGYEVILEYGFQDSITLRVRWGHLIDGSV